MQCSAHEGRGLTAQAPPPALLRRAPRPLGALGPTPAPLFPKYIFIDFREGGREIETTTMRELLLAASCAPHTGDPAHPTVTHRWTLNH